LIKCEYGNDTQEKVNKVGMLWRLYKKGVNNMIKYKIEELPNAWETYNDILKSFNLTKRQRFYLFIKYDILYWFIIKWEKLKDKLR